MNPPTYKHRDGGITVPIYQKGQSAMSETFKGEGAAMKIVVHTARKARFRDIARGFCDGHDVRFFDDVGFRFFGEGPSKTVLHSAFHSSRLAHETGLKTALKRWVLKSQYRWSHNFLRNQKPDFLLVWNGIKGHRALLVEAARSLGIGVVYFEEAPLPNRIAVDTTGVNFGSSLPRNSQFYRNWCDRNDADTLKWRVLEKSLKSRAATHNLNVGQARPEGDFAAGKFVFFPLQVEGDSQITKYGDWISSVRQSVQEIYKASRQLPDGWHVRVKEHPSSRQAIGAELHGLKDDKFQIDNETDTMQQVKASRAVVTVNSSVGLQAFFYDKPVLVLGKAMFAFDELAIKIGDAKALEERFVAPEKWKFSPQQRDDFMTYLDRVQFPTEQSVTSADYRLANLLARDV